jgi:[ribosomal protein S18]-alanine N-acetyltransferase
MLRIEHFTELNSMEQVATKAALIDFLYTHLDRFRDEKSAISKAIDYAFSPDPGRGGFVLLALDEDEVVGALIMNNTGMKEFIPEYILVYIAVNAEKRGQGIGKSLIDKAFEASDGNIALHVEYDNPAKRLYERMGFTSKYAEMRWQRK